MKKKILFVINSLGCGGAEKSLISMLSAFDYERYEVYLQMFRLEGMFLNLLPSEVHILPEFEYIKFSRLSLREQIKHPQLLYVKVKTSIGLRCDQNNLHDAQCYWKYAGRAFEMLKDEYDVAIAWGQGNPTHFVCEKVNAKKKIAFINADYEAVGHKREFDYPFYKKYDNIVAVSDELRKTIIEVFPDMMDKIVTIYDIINAELINRMSMQGNPFHSNNNKVRIVTVGRLVTPKGYDLLVQAAKILKDKGVLFEWYIIGDGPERKNVEDDILRYDVKGCVFLLGAKENPYVYMKNADIYVQTSRTEGYCLTLNEARILNLPIVSTNFDAVHDQLINGENGLIVEMTGEAIEKGITKMLTEKSLQGYIVKKLENEKKGNIEEISQLYMLFESEEKKSI